MTNYRRHFIPGGAYFFTVNLQDRGLTLLTDSIDLLRSAFHQTRIRRPFTIEAIVILPDHLHAIWTLPEGDADFPTRWRQIKSSFSRGLAAVEPISASRRRKGERGIWQRRYWERALRDEEDFARHVDYIHFKPVKHGHAPDPAAWPYSSFHRWEARNAPTTR
jgi:putative transposase